MTDENGLVQREGWGDEQLATPEELAAFEGRFLRLLERRTAIYTQGDSTSVPTHVAADLLLSIAFVLGIDPGRPEVPRELLSVDLEDEYRRRLDAIAARVAAAEELWREVCQTMPLIENIALRDTLKSLGDFFKWYDYRCMAHEIPCCIDYPLCHPVPETLQGIDYIEEYLRRLMIEARFLACFEVEAIERVLKANSRDHIELLINLFEPVATNAIGRAMIEKDPCALTITGADRVEIEILLGALPGGRQEKALRKAAVTVCASLALDEAEVVQYISVLASELLPRLRIGLVRCDLRGVFHTN